MTTLAELRQANLQEQKKQEEQPPANGHATEQSGAPAEQTAPAPLAEQLAHVAPETTAIVPSHEPKAPRASAGLQAMPRTPIGAADRRRSHASGNIKESDQEALVEILPAISKAVVSLAAQVAVNEGEPQKSAAFLNRVRGALNHKVLYPSGVKTTVDMSPAVFHRAKKYCLDHGNVTLRQLFLDLLTEYLAEEGY